MEWKNKLRKFDIKNIKKDELLIILLVGILLVVIALPTTKKESKVVKSANQTETTTKAQAETETSSYINELEKRLEEVLRRVQGVGDVDVMITLKSSKELIIEKDTPTTNQTSQEEDAEGGKRNTVDKSSSETTVYEQDNNGSSIPYVVKELEPEIEGIIVIAKGGDDPVVVKNISDAVLALFHVEAHKIKVMKMN
jgi:stage III sporulation protein AG